MKIRLLQTLIISIISFIFAPALAADRGIVPIEIKDRSGNQVGLYNESHALVIGVSDYQEYPSAPFSWHDLPGVATDIQLVRSALETHGFHVVVVENPNHEELEKAFEDFIHLYGFDSNNRLLFFFSGHGFTLKLSTGLNMGYIVPSDAPPPDWDQRGFLNKAMDMQQMEVYAMRIQAKHALFLFDSCFSGSIFSLTKSAPAYINYKTNLPVRQFITAGRADEKVPDESIFRAQFISALEGEADADADGYLTGNELGTFIEKKVINYSKNSQHPQFGTLRNPYLDKGDFVFSLNDSSSLGWNIDSHPSLNKDQLEKDLEQKKKLLLEKHMKITSLLPKPSSLTPEILEEMVLIPGSKYMAGLDIEIGYKECIKYYERCKKSSFNNESPVHTVMIDSFLMDKHEVTQADFERVMRHNPSNFRGGMNPVEKVTWTEARDYCSKMGKRLPTEAEWEKAAKGRQNTIYPWGDDVESWNANFCDINCESYWRKVGFDDGYVTTAPVGSYDPNDYGLHDMAGNVYEWVSDWYSEDYYKTSPSNNPKGPKRGSEKVLRGGSWNNNPSFVRPTFRYSNDLSSRHDNIGFRCSLSLGP
jgi:formylglycine-generating enzyme required for sulfatase activity